MLGFSGNRNISDTQRTKVAEVIGGLKAEEKLGKFCSDKPGDYSLSVAVGCARGLDAIVRQLVPSAWVFNAESQRPRDLVKRSASLVKAVAASEFPTMLIWPGCKCPRTVCPSKSVSLCFCGGGSGSWATAAFAAGHGVPLFIFGVQVQSLPLSWGSWILSGRFGVPSFHLLPPTVQLPLF